MKKTNTLFGLSLLNNQHLAFSLTYMSSREMLKKSFLVSLAYLIR